MHASTPPLILIFDAFDPSGSSSLPADAVTFATLGCHALGALTAICVRDTARTEDVQPVSPDLIDDQARCLLEDMHVQAMQVGPLYTTESVSVLAHVAADYSHVPLVLRLDAAAGGGLHDESEAEEVQLATLELLLPQTDIVVADHFLLQQWQAHGLFAGVDAATPAQALLHYGASWVLTTNTPLRPGGGGLLLQSTDQQTAQWTQPSPPARLTDPAGVLTCAITSALAQGKDARAAVEWAIARSTTLLERSFQAGMGNRVLDRTTS